MSQPLLKCEHVDFGYENYDVVKDVSLEICQGDYLCIVGENGSGKSTLMKGLLGLLKPTGGSLMVSDDLKRSGIGYLPQQTPAQKDFPATVQEVVISGCLGKRGNRPFYSKKERETAAVNMERLGITDLRKSCYRDLSGGQKQRTLIARALCATDRLLILDEPITGLDAGRPMVVRTPDADFSLANFMRSHLYSAVATLKIGMDILLKEEHVAVDSLMGHGGFFKTPVVGQRVMAAGMNAPITVMDTASEGGAWGIAILAAFMKEKKDGETLSSYLNDKIFAGQTGTTLNPDVEDVKGFDAFLEEYKKLLPAEKAAVAAK